MQVAMAASHAAHWSRTVAGGAVVVVPGCPRCPAAGVALPTSPHGQRRWDWCLGCQRRAAEGAEAKVASGGVVRVTEACHLSTWHALVTPRVVAEAACGTAAGVTGVVAPAAVGRGLLPCPLLPFLHRHQLAAAAAAAPSPQRPPSLVAWRKRKRAVGVVGTVAAAASAPVAAEWRPPVEAVEAPRGPAPAAACSGGWPSAPSGPAWQPPPAAAACSGSPGAGASRRQP